MLLKKCYQKNVIKKRLMLQDIKILTPKLYQSSQKYINYKIHTKKNKSIKSIYRQQTKKNNLSINKMNQQLLFNNEDILNLTSRNKPRIKNSSLNPWTQNQIANPFLNMKNETRQNSLKKQQLRKINQRKKILSLDQLKSNKHMLHFITKQTQQTKVIKQLPKLNIDNLLRNDVMKKKKTINTSSGQYIINSNSSAMYFSSPTLKKMGQLHQSTQLSRKSNILPSVSRQLNVARKIYLLSNKMSNLSTLSPNKRSFRQQCGGDIRRLVQKQWSKKLQ